VRHDSIESVAALAHTKFALDNISVTNVLILLPACLTPLILVLRWASQYRTGHLNISFFAPDHDLAIPIDLVRQHPRRIKAVFLPVAFHRSKKVGSLIERIKGKPLDFGIAIYHADVKLGAKFCICMSLASHNGPDPRLRKADDAIFHTMGVVLVHVKLLLIECRNRVQKVCLLFGQLYAIILDHIRNKTDIPDDVLQLLPHPSTNLFGTAFLAFGQVQIVSAGTFTTHPGAFQFGRCAELVHHMLQMLAGIIEQLKVLRKCHIRRAAGCIHKDRSAVSGR